jgi:hypothetical protein
MTKILRWIWFTALLVAFGAGNVAMYNWLFQERVPVWLGVVSALSFGAVWAVLSRCDERGLVKGVFRRRDRLSELESRRRSLAADRERWIAEARARRERVR